MLYQSLIALFVWSLVGLCQLGLSMLSKGCLLKGFSEAGDRHVVPFGLASVILLHTVTGHVSGPCQNTLHLISMESLCPDKGGTSRLGLALLLMQPV